MEHFYNQKKDYGYYDQPIHPTGSSMASAAVIAGIVSLVTMWTLYLPIVAGGLGMIFAYLSQGFEKRLSSNAKMGFIFSAACFFICTVILIGGALYLYGNPDRFLEIGQQLDQMGVVAEFGFSYEEMIYQLINSFR